MRPELFPPRPERAKARWALLSVFAHAAALGVLVLISTAGPPSSSVRYINPAASAPRSPTLIAIDQWPAGARAAGTSGSPAAPVRGATPKAGGVTMRPPSASALPAARPPEHREPPIEGGATVPPGRTDTAAVAETHRTLGPAYGDGRLWLDPAIASRLGAAAGDSNQAFNALAHVEKVDSAVAQKLRAFLDTMPPDSMAVAALPSWTTKINGQTWGIDSKWIYLGGIKLPSALLALLPLPQGNYEQAQREARLMDIRGQILSAAERAQNTEDFKRYVKELRARNEAKHEAEKQQTQPQKAPADTVIN